MKVKRIWVKNITNYKISNRKQLMAKKWISITFCDLWIIMILIVDSKAVIGTKIWDLSRRQHYRPLRPLLSRTAEHCSLGLTSGNVDKVLSVGAIDFNVSLADVVFVSLESHVSVLLVDEPDQCFAVSPALRTQTERHSSSKTDRHTITVIRLTFCVSKPFQWEIIIPLFAIISDNEGSLQKLYQ